MGGSRASLPFGPTMKHSPWIMNLLISLVQMLRALLRPQLDLAIENMALSQLVFPMTSPHTVLLEIDQERSRIGFWIGTVVSARGTALLAYFRLLHCFLRLLIEAWEILIK